MPVEYCNSAEFQLIMKWWIIFDQIEYELFRIRCPAV